MITDELIKQFIDGISEDYTFSEAEINYVRNYSGCKPGVPDYAAKKAKEIISERFPSVYDNDNALSEINTVNALTVGFGADKILCGNAVNETSYQNEYYCHAISRALNQKKFLDGTYKLRFRDLADYFTNYKGNNLKFNLVLVTPDYSSYHEIDSDAIFRDMNSFAYYTMRGFYFLRPGGVLYSVIPSRFDQSIRDGMFKLQTDSAGAKINIIRANDYSIIQIEHQS